MEDAEVGQEPEDDNPGKEDNLDPSQVQALKHFDELLRAAQEVVNDADLGEFDGQTQVLHIDKDVFDSLKSIIQKISDEAVQIITKAGKEKRWLAVAYCKLCRRDVSTHEGRFVMHGPGGGSLADGLEVCVNSGKEKA